MDSRVHGDFGMDHSPVRRNRSLIPYANRVKKALISASVA